MVQLRFVGENEKLSHGLINQKKGDMKFFLANGFN